MNVHMHWHAFDAVIAVALAWMAWAYLRPGARRRTFRPWHLAAFIGGWLALVLALLSPLAGLAESRFWIHMIQHEILMLVAAPLIVLASPLGAIAQALSRRVARQVYRPLRYVSPLVAWLLHAAALWIWHAPPLFRASVDIEWVHVVQHLSFFGTALLFWWSVFRHAASAAGVVCVLTTMIHMGVLGALLTFAPVSLYAGYDLADQQLGGLIMWVPAGFVMLALGLWTFNRWLDYQT